MIINQKRGIVKEEEETLRKKLESKALTTFSNWNTVGFDCQP